MNTLVEEHGLKPAEVEKVLDLLREAYELGYRGYVGLECRPKTTERAAAEAVARADLW